MTIDTNIIWLVATFVILSWLSRWIARHIQGIGFLVTEQNEFGLNVYLLLTFPGVFLHELSHALAARLMGVRVRRFSIGIRRRRGQVVLGSVDIAQTDPLRASLIGIAPLVSGCAVILIISSQIFGFGQFGPFNLGSFWRELPGIYTAPDLWFWGYLILAVGNAMFPSAADRHAWWLALIFILFVGTVLYFAGLLDDFSGWAGGWAQSAVLLLTYAFAVTIVIDVAFAAILFAFEQGLALFGFGRVQY